MNVRKETPMPRFGGQIRFLENQNAEDNCEQLRDVLRDRRLHRSLAEGQGYDLAATRRRPQLQILVSLGSCTRAQLPGRAPRHARTWAVGRSRPRLHLDY